MKPCLNKCYQIHNPHGINNSMLDQRRNGINVGIRSLTDVFSQLLFNIHSELCSNGHLICGNLFTHSRLSINSGLRGFCLIIIRVIIFEYLQKNPFKDSHVLSTSQTTFKIFKDL
jgi:hypothetical protein